MDMFVTDGQKVVFTLKAKENGAIAVIPSAGQQPEFSTTETVSTPMTADHQVTLCKCPGDFSQIWPCEYQGILTGGNLFTTTEATGPS